MAFYKEDILDIELSSGSIARSFLHHTIGSGDEKANRYGVRLFRDGEPVSAESATVTGLFMAPDGTRYVISETSFPGSTGTEWNKAYVQLPGVCYAVTGQFTLAIKLSGGGIEGTMRIIDGTVDETGEDGAVVPTSTIPTTEEIIAAYEEAVAVMGGSVRFDAAQSLTSAQKATARGNIGATDSMRNVSFAYAGTPVSVVHDSTGSTVTIPESIRITTKDAILNTPAATLTIPAGTSNWITFDRTANEWVAGYAVSGHETYTIGWVSNNTRQSFIACQYTNYNEGDTALQKIAYSFSATPITVVHDSERTTITIPESARITTPGGIIVAGGATLTTSGNAWISYDVDAGEWVLNYTVTGHKTYTIGWVSFEFKASFIAGWSTDTNETAVVTKREWGFMYSKTKLPEIQYAGSENTLKIYDSNIVYSGGVINASGQTLTFNTPKWLAYDVDASEFVLSTIVNGHTVILLGVLDASKIDNSYIAGTQLAIPKTIAFMGDSITAGSGTNKCFHQYIQERYGFTCLNYGYGGSGWVRSNPNIAGLVGIGNQGRGIVMTEENQILPNNIVARLSELTPANIDGVVIAAGTNDWGHSNEITLSQFRSGVDSTFEYYFEHFGLIPLLVMIPIHRINDTSPVSPGTWTLMDFADALIEECRKYGVPYVDTMSMSGCQPNNEYNANAYFARDDTHLSDGIHPNHYAHERLMRAIGETLNQLIKYDNRSMR